MALNIYNIKRWLKMLTGNSILHVNQGVGKIYSTKNVEGYYNDLTEKVTRNKELYNSVKIPLYQLESGKKVVFPIDVFQYGLGSYDLYLLENNRLFLEKFKLCVDWSIDNQELNGAWNTFFFHYPDTPYSAMAQGEGISLLLRAYIKFEEEIYLKAAEKAVEFLIKPIEEGGTSKYTNGNVFLKEYMTEPTVLNGWIFAIFGLYDYLKIVKDKTVADVYHCSIKTMIHNMERFDNGYWSKYDISNMIASPFYHDLHIAQLAIMYEITEEEIFKKYQDKWIKYKDKRLNRYRSFINKAIQKIKEK